MNERMAGKNAFKIGFVCIFTYVISYYVRNILGVLTPSMLKSGVYTEEYLALLASVYMIVYASGQLVNGIIGDYVKPKYMVALGLSISAAGLFLFSFVNAAMIGILSFGIIGFGLSMLRGPLVKVISENTLPKYARICCVFLSFASFAGPLLAGFASMVLQWHGVFVLSGALCLAMAAGSFVVLTIFEKRGLIIPLAKQKREKTAQSGGIFALFKLPNFVMYMVVGMVVEVAAASISFWMPTYFNQHLALSEAASGMMFSAISLVRSICPFLCLVLFRLLGERDVLITRCAFFVAAGLFLAMFFVESVWLNILLFTIALMCSSISSATLWSIYIPSLSATGKVSSANGVLDCTGYIAASIVNVAIVPVMTGLGWSGVILFWGGVMLVGALVTLFAKKRA